VRRGEKQATSFRRRFPPFPLQSGGRFGAGEDGERGLRLPWYILSTKGSLVPIGGGRRAEATLLLWNKCLQLFLCLAGEFFDASGELQWYVLDGFGELSFLSDLVELGLGWIFCQASLVWDLLLGAGLQWCFLSERCTSRLSFVGGLTLAISFLFSFVCVEVQISCVLLWGLCNFLVKRGAESVSYNIPGWRSLDAFAGFVFTGFLYLQGVFFWRFVSTDSMKPGWFLPTTCVGGSAPLLGAPSAGVLRVLAATGVSDFSKAGVAMAIGHLWKPGRSVPRKHVIDVLLKTAIKSFVSSPVGGSAPGHGFRSSVARNTGRGLQGPECIFYFYQGCLCMSCNHQNLE